MTNWLAIPWVLLWLGCAQTRPMQNPHHIPAPLTVYRYPPPPIYTVWLAQLNDCLAFAVQRDTSFTLEAPIDSVEQIVWLAVPTEHWDGSWLREGNHYWGMHTGESGVADTIYISGQVLLNPRIVKHELMHIRVRSPTERLVGAHGSPWGLCEYI